MLTVARMGGSIAVFFTTDMDSVINTHGKWFSAGIAALLFGATVLLFHPDARARFAARGKPIDPAN